MRRVAIAAGVSKLAIRIILANRIKLALKKKHCIEHYQAPMKKLITISNTYIFKTLVFCLKLGKAISFFMLSVRK
jgi:hypothetical protein